MEPKANLYRLANANERPIKQPLLTYMVSEIGMFPHLIEPIADNVILLRPSPVIEPLDAA